MFASPQFSFLSPVLFIPGPLALSQVIKHARFLLLDSLPSLCLQLLFPVFHSFILSLQGTHAQSSAENQNQWDRLSPPPDLFAGIGSSDVEAGKSDICRADWQAGSLAGMEPAVLDETSLRNLRFCRGG